MKLQRNFKNKYKEYENGLMLLLTLMTITNCQYYSSCLEKKFPWVIGGSADEYNTRLDGDGSGNLFMCGMTYSK